MAPGSGVWSFPAAVASLACGGQGSSHQARSPDDRSAAGPAAPSDAWRSAPDFTVDAAARDELIAKVLAELDDKYLFPEVAAKNRPELAKRWADNAMKQ